MSVSLHVEVLQKSQSIASKDYLKEIVHCYLADFTSITPGAIINTNALEDSVALKNHVQSITFCDVEHDSEINVTECEFVYHVYRLDNFDAEVDTMTDVSSGEELSAAVMWTLPHTDFHGLWESLVYDSKLKEDTLRFAETAFEFAERGIDPNMIGWNRVVLLHGPTGTGKTSLCRALAQKLAIRLQHRFPRTRLLEINAHGLFSKWFSESGKLVAKLFDRIREIVEDRRLLACVLVDEVESLAHARRAALSGLEPSDSIRAVNAILTQLDQLKRYSNALVLTTSNITGAIDVAFVDRADIKRRVGPPSERAAYVILQGCCEELMTHSVIVPQKKLLSLRVLEALRFAETEGSQTSLRLWRVASLAASAQISGRALRRLPFLARALYTRREPNLSQFIDALQAALHQQLKDASDLINDDAVSQTIVNKTNGL